MSELLAASFPSANRFGYIACNSKPSPVERVPVRIEIQPRMAPGDTIELEVQGYLDANGTQPVPGTKVTFAHVISVIGGQLFVELDVVPYATAIKPIGSGWLGAEYKVTRGAGTVGQSKRVLMKVDVIVPGRGTCPE